MISNFEAPPVPGIERSSSPILGAGVLDVPTEIWGHLHEPFREVRTASLFGLRNSAVSSEFNMRLENAQVSSLLWVPN